MDAPYAARRGAALSNLSHHFDRSSMRYFVMAADWFVDRRCNTGLLPDSQPFIIVRLLEWCQTRVTIC